MINVTQIEKSNEIHYYDKNTIAKFLILELDLKLQEIFCTKAK